MSDRCILFDFFGTLVAYSPSRTEQGYEGSHALLRRLGSSLDYASFLDLWARTSEQFDAEADRVTGEFSMHELTAEFLLRAVGATPSKTAVDRFVETYLAEWNRGVRYFAGIHEFLGRLRGQRRLGIVTNTHSQDLVENHLVAMGIRSHFDSIVTSLGERCRKPRAEIFRTALRELDAASEATIFVGDSLEADYRGAEAVGMTPILVAPGPGDSAEASNRISSLFELEAWMNVRGM